VESSHYFAGRIGKHKTWLICGSYMEACGFIDGFFTFGGVRSALEFQRWLYLRGIGAPEIPYSVSVLRADPHFGPGFRPCDVPDKDAPTAIDRLLRLLVEFLEPAD
jgi:hypothetical protein